MLSHSFVPKVLNNTIQNVLRNFESLFEIISQGSPYNLLILKIKIRDIVLTTITIDLIRDEVCLFC